jgi:hypothetical protein
MILAVVPLVLSTLPASVARADSKSDVTPEGTIYSSPTPDDGTRRTFTGDVEPFGPISGILNLNFDSYGNFTGLFAIKARGGNAYGTIKGQFTTPGNYVETLIFTGGTGKYSRISGYADVSGVLNPDGTAIDTVNGGSIDRK